MVNAHIMHARKGCARTVLPWLYTGTSILPVICMSKKIKGGLKDANFMHYMPILQRLRSRKITHPIMPFEACIGIWYMYNVSASIASTLCGLYCDKIR